MEGGRRIYFLFRFDTGCQLIITIISSISSSNSWVFVLRLCVEKNALSSLREDHSNIIFFTILQCLFKYWAIGQIDMDTDKNFIRIWTKTIGEIIFNDNASIIFFQHRNFTYWDGINWTPSFRPLCLGSFVTPAHVIQTTG